MGSTPVGVLENSFSEYFDLRALLRYLHLSKSLVHLSSPVVFVSVSVCNCASLMCDNNPTMDYLPSLNLPVPMYTS